jgi:TP901 family phage tail tape measure protein
MASIGAMSLILSADPGKMQKGLSQGIASMANFGTAAASMAATVASGLGGMFSDVAASAASFLGLKTGLGELTTVGIDFERQMSAVAAVSGATGEALDALTEKAREMGRETEYSSTQAAKAMEALAQAGFTTSEIMSSLSDVLDLARVGEMELGKTADLVAVAIRTFKLEARDAARVADLLAKTSVASITSVEDLGEAFKYAAPAAASTGRSMEDVLAALGLMSQAGIRGSMAGTALRGIMLKMGRPTAEAAAALKDIGVEFFDAEGKAKKFSQIVLEVGAAIEHMNDQQQIEFFGTQFEARAGTGFVALKNQGAKAMEDFEKMIREGSEGAAKEMGKIKIDNVWGAIKIVQSAWEGLAEMIFSKSKGPMRQGIENLTALVSGLLKGFKPAAEAIQAAFSFPGAGKLAKDIQKAWFDVGAGIGPAIAGVVKEVAPLIQASVKWFAEVMKGGSVVRQFGNILGTLIGNLGQIAQFLGGTGGPLGNLLPNKDQILEGLIAIEYGLKTLGPAAELSTLKMHLAIRENLLDPIENTGRFMTAWKDYMLDAWTDLADGMVFVMQGATGIIADTIHSLGASIVKFLQDPSQGFQFNMPGVDKVSRAFRSMTAPPPMWGDFGGESSDTAGLRARAEELGTSINNGFWDHMNARKKELREAGEEYGGGVLAGIGGDIMGAAGAGIAGVVGDLTKKDDGSSGGQAKAMEAFEVKMAEAVMAGSAEAISLANKFRLERDIGGGKKSVEDQQLEVQKKMLEELKGKGGAVVSIG